MNKKVIELLAGTLQLDVEELTKVLTSEDELELKLPENLKVITNEDLEALKDNHGKTRYDAGKTAGSEMLLKDISEKVGFETPIKDIEGFIETYSKQILDKANIEPNKKVEELESSVKKLQGIVTEKDSAYTQLQNSLKAKETKFKAQSYIPTLPESLGLNRDEATSIFFMSHEIKEDGIYKNGEILKDKLEKSLDLSEAVKSFVTEKGWDKKANASGRGGGSGNHNRNQNGEAKSLKEFEAEMSEKGINVGSMEFNAQLQEQGKANPELLN